jgi:hypothetical protein
MLEKISRIFPGVAATRALIVRYSDELTVQYNYSRFGEDVCIVSLTFA